MYQNLLYSVKKRIIYEIEGAFQNHPAFTEKVRVYHKFPYTERVQYGVVLKNVSASQMRLSPDNYIADLISHVKLAVQTTYPGNAIEWVRENSNGVTEYIENEDVSSQLSPTQRMFLTRNQIVSGQNNTLFADNVGQVVVTVNGEKVLPEFVNGERKVVLLRTAPPTGSTVLISYYARKIVPPGIYVIDFIEDNEFTVAPIYIVKKELVIESTTGTEVTAPLANQNICQRSLYLFLKYKNSNVPVQLTEGTDYSVDLSTGIITFLVPLLKNYQLLADYRWQPTDYYNGPYKFEAYQENHTALPGVVIAIGRRAKKGDQQAVIVSQFREQQARIYGGHWTMSMDLSVIAKDPLQMEEMAEQVINWLWAVRKNSLEFEGITLNSVEPAGESEESYIDTTGEIYYTTSIAINVQTEWQRFMPYPFEIREIIPSIKLWPGTKDYKVSKDLTLTLNFQADTRPVIKYPMAGYEKLL